MIVSEEDLVEGYKIIEIEGFPKDWNDRQLFKDTLDNFLKKEEFLLKHGLNERTITHKLAEYLNIAFSPNYDVDCEYNRMHKETVNAEDEYIEKTLHLDKDNLDPANETTVFPDIILHNRIGRFNNYLIIEVKKKYYADQTIKKTNETYRNFDKKKIRAYLRELKYKLGIYIEFEGTEIRQLNSFLIVKSND
jgi:hypothetical protein